MEPETLESDVEEEAGDKYPFVLECINHPYGRKILPGDDQEEQFVRACEYACLGEGVYVRENDTVYVNGDNNELLVAIVNAIYRVCDTLSTPDEDKAIVVDVSWMYRWDDVPQMKKTKLKFHEKLGGTLLPDGHRELMYTAHRDTIDLASVRRPVKVWFIPFKGGKCKIPEITFSMAGKIRTEPVGGFICTRFMDTILQQVYPLEQVREDVKAKTFEDNLIPQVMELMQRTEKDLHTIRKNDAGVRRAHTQRMNFKTVLEGRSMKRLIKQGPQAQTKNDAHQAKADSGYNKAPSSNIETLPRQTSVAETEGKKADTGEGQKQVLHPTSSQQDKSPGDYRTSIAQQPLGESCSNSPRNVVDSTHPKTVNVTNVDGVEHVLLRQSSGATAREDVQETVVIACMDSAESGSSISLG